MKEWVKMPSKKYMDTELSPLKSMTWSGAQKSGYIASLMIYMVLVHHVNEEDSVLNGPKGTVTLSYEKLCELTGISRTKVSEGLKVLQGCQMIRVKLRGRNNEYEVIGYIELSRWAKLPAKGLYDKKLSTLVAFKSFKLRSKIELNALKIYLVLVAFRDEKTNYSRLSYENISKYACVQRNDIRGALSLLVTMNFIQVDSEPTEINEYSTSNVYRLCFLEVYRHRGTQAKKDFLDIN